MGPTVTCVDPSGRGGGAAPAYGSHRPLDDALLDTAILVIEDEAMIAWQLESLFEDMGFTVIDLASNGSDAIALAASSPPGLIVSDINLGGGVDGVESVATILGVAAAAIPVLFVTGYASTEMRDRIDSEIVGATVLRKPVLSADLRDAVIVALRPLPRQ